MRVSYQVISLSLNLTAMPQCRPILVWLIIQDSFCQPTFEEKTNVGVIS